MRTVTIAMMSVVLSLSAVAANAKTGNSGYAGSGSVSTRPTPTPPRSNEKPPMIKNHGVKLNCYHTREQNKFGIYVHRTHCG